MKKLCTKRIYLFLYSIVLFPNIYFTISQGTPYYPVKGKWVVAPEGMTFTKEEIREQIHFQEQYFDSEIVM